MSRKKRNSTGRREFLKMGAIFSAGSLVIDPVMMRAMAQVAELAPGLILRPDLYCDLYRSEDLLFLRAYLINAKVVAGTMIKRRSDQHPLFMYVKLPTQHVSEELVVNPTIPLTPKSSFAADGSWLAFKLLDRVLSVDLTVDNVLDWNTYFQLVTLNDYGLKGADGQITKMDNALKWLSQEFGNRKVVDEYTGHQNRVNNLPVPWPLTKFAVPYKLFLSPIGEPVADNSPGAAVWARQAGNFSFTNTNRSRLEYQAGVKGIRIIRPWTNGLAFLTPDGRTLPPRLKAVHYYCPTPEDKDDKLDLLPAPIHRYELQGLTMRAPYDRDINTDLFRFSAYGGSMHLFYRNSHPLEYSMVAWEQKFYAARDNYISVTVRAIDYFTGLKVLLSIIGDRDYKDGLSFIPRRYFVTYDEDSKDYTDSAIISQLPFTKIVPLSKGAFFFPKDIPLPAGGNIANAYAVYPPEQQSAPYDPTRLLTFDYLCYDKKGDESRQQFRMILIPAENYTIYKGTYNYYENGALIASYTPANPNVPITHIGQLNPARLEKFETNPLASPCGEVTNVDYWFRMNKFFNTPGRAALDTTLQQLQAHVLANRQPFTSFAETSITYARLNKLKGTADSTGVVKDALIRNDSSNATFPTSSLLQGGRINPRLYAAGIPATQDNFLDPFPLLTVMEFATVVISQIDQIEGKSVYREVNFAPDYIKGQVEIDEVNSANSTKLLFKLAAPLDDFFSKNYRNAGAVVNPGIDITFVSVLDQGVIYNDGHNRTKEAEGIALAAGGELLKQANSFSIASIFKPLKAEILGIQLTVVLEDSLPIEDFPVLAFVQQAEDAVNKLDQLIQEYTAMVNMWKQRYADAKAQVQGYINQIKNLESTLRLVLENKFRSWLEGLMASAEAKIYYKQLQKNLSAYTTTYNNYKTTVLQPVLKAYGFYTTLEPLMKDLVDQPTAGKVYALVTKVQQLGVLPQQAGEVLQLYITLYDETQLQLEALRFAIHALEQDAVMLRNEAYMALRQGLQDASLYIQRYVQEQAAVAEAKINEGVQHILSGILADAPDIFNLDVLNGVLKLYEWVMLYKQYARIYQELRKGHYEQVARELGIGGYTTAAIDALEKSLIQELIATLRALPLDQLPSTFRANAETLRQKYIEILTRQPDDALRQFEAITKKELQAAIDNALTPYVEVILAADKAYEDATKEIRRIKALLDDREKFIREFIQRMIDETKAELEKEIKALVAEAVGTDAYKKAQQNIATLKGILQKIAEFSKQKLDYTFSTDKIKAANLGGVIDFIPNKSKLDVKVSYEYELDISQIDRLPTIKKQSFYTDSTLTDFKLGFLQILFIDFKKVQFIAGSDVKDDFIVEIRNVEFSGFLSFVQAFQKWLKSIDDNLVFDIDATGARIGYGVRIPDIPAGYFNFFNLSLAALLTLPFEAGKSMQLKFGLGTELSKFGITVSGVFGGQGYFNLIAEPKRGIVGMEMALEFGAIFQLNLAVAWGNAYLVGGVYIRRYDGNFKLKAYILAVGRLEIIGIFSATLSFYLGLEGNSSVLEGVCVVEAKKRFSRFFELKVKCKMTKTLKGGDSNDNRAARKFVDTGALDQLALAGVHIEDTNLRRGYVFDGEGLFICLSHAPTQPVTARLQRTGGAGIMAMQALQADTHRSKDNYSSFVSIPAAQLSEPGEYELILDTGTQVVKRTFTVIREIRSDCRNNPQLPISDFDYYNSYYQF